MILEITMLIIFAVGFMLLVHYILIPQIAENERYQKELPELCTHPEFYYTNYSTCIELGVKP